MKLGKFNDAWRGDGVFISFSKVLLALRGQWHLYAVKPPAKPGYFRIYVGPIELEFRK